MRRLRKFLHDKFRIPETAGEKGFTLLEVIIALAIMILALSSILTVESNSINASARARQMNIVAMLAKSKMVEVEYSLEGKTFDEVKKEDGGNFETPYEDFRWTRTITELEFPNLAPSGAQGGGGAEGSSDVTEMLTKLVTNFLSKAMREVTVTIFWRRGTAEQKFSVSTYWVDLNHEFELQP